MLTKLFCKAQARLIEFKNDERGVTAIEYGLIAVATAVALVSYFGTSGSIGTALSSIFNSVSAALTTTTSTTG